MIEYALGVLILGMYIPIIVLSGAACYLYVTRVFIPAIRGHYFNLETHAVAMAAILALGAHFSENVYYGVGRFKAEWFDWMTNQLLVVGLMKLLILGSAILATAVYNKAIFGSANFKKLIKLAVALWLVGVIIAYCVGVQRV